MKFGCAAFLCENLLLSSTRFFTSTGSQLALQHQFPIRNQPSEFTAMSNNLQRGKNAIHGLQALIIFISWVLTIAVFTKTGQTDGRSKYYFTLVSILQARKFPNAHKRINSACSVSLLSSIKQPSQSSNEPGNS